MTCLYRDYLIGQNNYAVETCGHVFRVLLMRLVQPTFENLDLSGQKLKLIELFLQLLFKWRKSEENVSVKN